MSQVARKPYEPAFRNPRIKDAAHLAAIRECDCIICGAWPVEAAHIRYPDNNHDKLLTGKGEKPHDKWALPLCHSCHRTGEGAQHSMNERKFWQMHNINPLKVCEQLYSAKNKVSTMRGIINKIRMMGQ